MFEKMKKKFFENSNGKNDDFIKRMSICCSAHGDIT